MAPTTPTPERFDMNLTLPKPKPIMRSLTSSARVCVAMYNATRIALDTERLLVSLGRSGNRTTTGS